MLDFVVACCGIMLFVAQWGRIDDRIDAINFVLPYLCLVGMIASIAALVWAWRRGKRLPPRCAGALTILALSLPLLWSEWQSAAGTAVDCSGRELKIVEFNIWKENPDVASVVAWLRLANADVVVLEEAQTRTGLETRLADLYPYRQDCLGADRCSTVILSKVRPLASGALTHGDPENRAALSAAWMSLASDAGPFTLVGVHLDRPWPFPHYPRDREELADFLKTRDPDSTIVTGDFNLPGWTFQMRHLEQAIGIPRRTRALPTWPAFVAGHSWHWPLLGIDQLFAGEGWQVVDLHRGPSVGSDHFPLVATLNRCRLR